MSTRLRVEIDGNSKKRSRKSCRRGNCRSCLHATKMDTFQDRDFMWNCNNPAPELLSAPRQCLWDGSLDNGDTCGGYMPKDASRRKEAVGKAIRAYERIAREVRQGSGDALDKELDEIRLALECVAEEGSKPEKDEAKFCSLYGVTFTSEQMAAANLKPPMWHLLPPQREVHPTDADYAMELREYANRVIAERS
jgi:hypothetical protein